MLEKLRAKPDHIKKGISLAFTIVVFTGIVLVWMSSWDAQQQEDTVREKTVSPLSGFSAMIDGLTLSIKDALSGTPSFVETNGRSGTTTQATSTGNFDVSGVVIIDQSTTTTKSTQQ